MFFELYKAMGGLKKGYPECREMMEGLCKRISDKVR